MVDYSGTGLQKEMVLNFDFEYRYLAGDVFTLMISTDFNGDPSSISSATWVDVTPDNLDKTNDKSFTSYSVDLASYIGRRSTSVSVISATMLPDSRLLVRLIMYM